MFVHEIEIWVGLERDSFGVGTDTTGIQAENSEVLFVGLVAVAVTTQFGGTETGRVMAKFEEQSVPSVNLDCPRNNCPSPYPEGSPAGLAKNSNR